MALHAGAGQLRACAQPYRPGAMLWQPGVYMQRPTFAHIPACFRPAPALWCNHLITKAIQLAAYKCFVINTHVLGVG